MGPDERRTENQIAVCVHPPERRRGRSTVAACCCCSCCCCLHSLGGLIGAAAAGKSRSVEEHSATSAYWLSLLAVLVVMCVWASVAGNNLMTALLILAMALPGYQIAASVIAGLIGGIIAGPAALSRIWSITWRSFVGAVIGLGIMLVIYLGASR